MSEFAASRPALILASSSPRRSELLRQIGVAFRVVVADVDESVEPGESPADYGLPCSSSVQLGLRRYETARAMLHKLRRAMVSPDRERLTDRVKVDETYIGVPKPACVDGAESLTRRSFVGPVEVRGRASGRVRLKVVPDVSARSLVRFVTANFAPGAVVLTDGWGA